MLQLREEGEAIRTLRRWGQVVSQNRLAVVLALTILAIVIVGWIVQLGGNYRAGSNRYGSYGEFPAQSPQEPP
jgi:hypothetical protein